jgi:hypothetical protein
MYIYVTSIRLVLHTQFSRFVLTSTWLMLQLFIRWTPAIGPSPAIGTTRDAQSLSSNQMMHVVIINHPSQLLHRSQVHAFSYIHRCYTSTAALYRPATCIIHSVPHCIARDFFDFFGHLREGSAADLVSPFPPPQLSQCLTGGIRLTTGGCEVGCRSPHFKRKEFWNNGWPHSE